MQNENPILRDIAAAVGLKATPEGAQKAQAVAETYAGVIADNALNNQGDAFEKARQRRKQAVFDRGGSR